MSDTKNKEQEKPTRAIPWDFYAGTIGATYALTLLVFMLFVPGFEDSNFPLVSSAISVFLLFRCRDKLRKNAKLSA